MKRMLVMNILQVAITCLASSLMVVNARSCPDEKTCGWKALCSNGTCVCPVEYQLHSNEEDCQNKTCSQENCLDCSSPDTCKRCSNFIDEQTLLCLEKCNGQARKLQLSNLQGSVCQPFDSGHDNFDIIIGVAAGVSAGILLSVIVAVGFYCHSRRTRKNINLQQKNYKVENMQSGKLKTIPIYDNKGFEPDMDTLRRSMVDKDKYLEELEKLRAQAPSLLILLNQIRRKLRAMDPDDTRASTYKGVIHQMCRVLVLVHKKDPGASIPSDALGLLEWAQQMLEDYQMDSQVQNESESVETGCKISYIDVPEQSKHHQYAVPNVSKVKDNNPAHHQSQQSFTSHYSDTGYYSSAPVPVEYHSHTLPYAQIRNSVSTLVTDKHSKRKKQSRKTNSFNNLQHADSDLSVGYFANGHYYDPSPQPEIYAPASSYSDRSHKLMSTFLSDDARRHSIPSSSSSMAAIGETGERDNESVEDDPLPFDPKDATEPVEV